MTHENFSQKLTAFVAALAMTAGALAANLDPPDLPGGKDSPFISRFAGSSLVAFANLSFDQTTLPLTNEIEDKHFVKGQTIEGKITRIAYLAPAGTTVLEVTRNYQQALIKAGLKVQFSCEQDKCGSHRIQEPFIDYAEGMKQLQSYGGYSSVGFLVLNEGRAPYYFWGTLNLDGRLVYVSVFTSKMEASDGSDLKDRAGTFIEIIEPKAMDMGKVTVDASAIGTGIKDTGKIALYGVYFDTGKAVLKPESKDQLTQIGKFLTADKSIKVIVVGHTDNVGSIEANQMLSQQRASAVAAALSADYQIAPGRIIAKGVGNFCPVASNLSEEGRARNRRVELVQQ